MKKPLLLAVLLVAFYTAHSQAFVFSLSGGYAWPGLLKTSPILGFQPYLSSNIFETGKVLDPAYASVVNMADVKIKGSYEGSTFVDSFQSRKEIKDSYGRGGNFTVGLGYKIKPWISVMLNFNYVWGSSITSRQEFDNLGQILGKGVVVNTRTNAQGLSMMPSVVLSYATSWESKYIPYMRLGITVPVAGNTIHDIDITAPNGALYDIYSELRIKTESTISLGFNGALGFEYRPLPLVGIFAELNGNMLDVSAKKSTIEKYTIATTDVYDPNKKTYVDKITGVGEIPDAFKPFGANTNALSTYSKVITFEDEVSSASNAEELGKKRDPLKSGQAGYVNEDAPHQIKKEAANFNAFGFNIGVNINIGKAALAALKKK